MELTDEQRERIRKNRERALAIQKQRKVLVEKEQQQQQKEQQKEQQKKKRAYENTNELEDPLNYNNKKPKAVLSSSEPLEDFEVGASEWVNKTEAKGKYCLPDGTLAVCEVEERDNPRHKGWTPMKLYRRSEIRERAHKRHGGLEGLIAERNERKEKRLAKDMKEASKVFE
jgi:hypothetical protein